MKFRISTFGPNGFVSDRKINWIKDFREQTGCGLKEAKDVADWATSELGSRRASSLVIDTTMVSNFNFSFLEQCAMIEVGRCTMVERITPPEVPRSKVTLELERTANKLIKLGDYQKARAVLKILVNAR